MGLGAELPGVRVAELAHGPASSTIHELRAEVLGPVQHFDAVQLDARRVQRDHEDG